MATRSRKFGLISYLNKEQLDKCLLAHVLQIRCYEYIFHDKDIFDDIDEKENPQHISGTPKQPHFHLIIVTYNQCTLSAVKKWFRGYVDENGDINTLVQYCTDIDELDLYLTHEDKKSIARGKYIYPRSLVQCSDPNYFSAKVDRNYDNSVLASEMLLRGVPIRTVAKIYGKDFIYHYNTIKQYVNDVLIWEDKNIKDFNQLLEYQEKGSQAFWDIDKDF